MLDEAAVSLVGDAVAGAQVDRQRDELARRLGRRTAERRLRRMMGPGRLHDRLEDRQRHFRAGLAAPKGAALAVGIVVADPDRDRDVIGEADEPGVVLVIGGAGLAADIGREMLRTTRAVPRASTPCSMDLNW